MGNSVADQWLGAGHRFPIFPEWGWLAYTSGMTLVRQSIETILDTEPGERIMLPDFGCGLRRYLMQPNTLTMRTSMRLDIVASLERWEPRIRLTSSSRSWA